PTLFRALRAVHRRAPAIVQVHLADGAAIAARRAAREQQAQRALASIRDERAAPAGRDLADMRAVDPHVDGIGAPRVVDEERGARLRSRWLARSLALRPILDDDAIAQRIGERGPDQLLGAFGGA